MDSREAFEAINVIPDNAEFCEKHQMYKVKQYRGIITHPVNKQWESFQEGAEWQASRQASVEARQIEEAIDSFLAIEHKEVGL